MPNTSAIQRKERITSIHSLTRTLIVLLTVAGLVFAAALLFVLFIADETNSILSDRNRVILFGPVLLIFFVGAIFVFPIGWLKTVKWMLIMAFNVRDDVPMYKYGFNGLSTVFLPSYLTPKGLEARSKVFDALKWLGSGSLLILLAFAMQYLAGMEDWP